MLDTAADLFASNRPAPVICQIDECREWVASAYAQVADGHALAVKYDLRIDGTATTTQLRFYATRSRLGWYLSDEQGVRLLPIARTECVALAKSAPLASWHEDFTAASLSAALAWQEQALALCASTSGDALARASASL